jgi:hypothetical protein
MGFTTLAVQKRRSTMKRVTLLSVLVILSLLAACGPSAPTSGEVVADKVEDMVGIWACSWGAGKFWFEGTVFNETDTVCDDKCTYEVRLVREGGETVALRWKVIEDDCTARMSCYGELTPRASSE